MKEFEEYLLSQGKSSRTVKIYSLYVSKYLEWYKRSYPEEAALEEATPIIMLSGVIKNYSDYLLNGDPLLNVKPNNGRTINVKIASLKAYNEYLVSIEVQKNIVINKNHYIKIQKVKKSPTKVTKKMVDKFTLRVEKSGIKFNGNVANKDFCTMAKRNYTIVVLLANTGLRCQEMLDLKEADISIKSLELLVRKGKRNKQRPIYLNETLASVLKEYLEYKRENNIPSEYLFISKSGKKLLQTSIDRIFNQYSERIPGTNEHEITPHKLRHYFATSTLNNGDNSLTLMELKDILGHESINTTMIYLDNDENTMRAKMAKQKH